MTEAEKDIDRQMGALIATLPLSGPEQATVQIGLSLLAGFLVDVRRIAVASEQIANSLAALERRPL